MFLLASGKLRLLLERKHLVVTIRKVARTFGGNMIDCTGGNV